MRTSGWFESAAQDLRYAMRGLIGSPSFTAVALVTLSLGMAATTAIFSTVNATLLRPLPYPRSNDLVDVRTRLVDGRVTTGLVSPAELELLKKMPSHVERASGFFNPFEASLMRDDGTPVRVMLAGTAEGFFDVLGLPMTAGRGFTLEELTPAGRDAPFLLVISHPAWVRVYGSDPARSEERRVGDE